ncbi:MAG: hypothetical protein HFJ38_08670, partial [Bacilli bacterium]|nr:hypothetical protein [Bacilli bacterium]
LQQPVHLLRDVQGEKIPNPPGVGKLGKVNCTTCGGDGQIERSGPCTAHTVSGGHYYCTSSSNHGNNVGQYH